MNDDGDDEADDDDDDGDGMLEGYARCERRGEPIDVTGGVARWCAKRHGRVCEGERSRSPITAAV